MTIKIEVSIKNEDDNKNKTVGYRTFKHFGTNAFEYVYDLLLNPNVTMIQITK